MKEALALKNRDVYQKDPTTSKLVNEGVASVNDDRSKQAEEVLRYELETFVCDGEYAKGMADILDTYLRNIDQATMPAVWVSGFYGSGKSHLVKMLRALWVDTKFSDGATARGIASLPQDVIDNLKELSTQGKRHGVLHAASGTLGAGASGSVRLALLRIIFKSVDLPEHYSHARFVMWLKREELYDQVRGHVESNGYDWNEEIENFYVAEGLHAALVSTKPKVFPTEVTCVETLNNLYPHVQDVSSDDMIKAMRDALSDETGKFPLTVIVLDEVQQYIGSDTEKSIQVQEVVEACSKNIEGKVLFIATGQTAITGTSHLKKLEGRFKVRVQLSDTDVDAVVRKVILAKKPEARQPIENVMTENLGEISRHLGGSTIGHSQSDTFYFPQDYPLLPVRRRFWENSLRVLDQTGTDSQLRGQLSTVHRAIQSNIDKPLGNVVPADYLYFNSADRLLQSRILPRKVYEKTMSWIKGSDQERLLARAVGLVFLINKISSSNTEIGIRSTVDAIADLLVEDIAAGSASLRSQLPALLDTCDLLMKVGDEYKIQTEESTAWNDDFRHEISILSDDLHRVEQERDDRIKKKYAEKMRKSMINQGNSQVPRQIQAGFDSQLPSDADKNLTVWVRHGWAIDENSVRADARQAGNQSPVVYVFVPKRSADDLRKNIIEFKAANATLEKRGVPTTAEGTEARGAMETAKLNAERKINELLEDAFSGVQVFQAGGNEILALDLQEKITEAAENSLTRLYPQFGQADHKGWEKVYDNAKKGAPDALKAVGHDGEPADHPVCKTVLAFIGAGKKGSEIRNHFESSPYGWSGDAVDGALVVLLVAGAVRAQDERGQAIEPKALERKAFGKATFKVESVNLSAAQRIAIRKLFQKLEIKANQNDLILFAPQFIGELLALAERAGGEAPKPSRPDTLSIDDLRLMSGNDQLLAIYNKKDELAQNIDDWTALTKKIDERWANWAKLGALLGNSVGLKDLEVTLAQVESIAKQRLLLDDPDQVLPLISSLTQLLRDELNTLKANWEAGWTAGEARLEKSDAWDKLDADQRHKLRAPVGLTEKASPKIDLSSTETILQSLKDTSIANFRDRIAAMPGRYDEILMGGAKLIEPEVQKARLPAATLKTDAEIDAWVAEASAALKEQLRKGPLLI